ncbi:hypothetical protein L6V77_30115 [Myxococcota bacterium]|nr:hypothetical protein [Myxococcota bacterium]
MTLGMLLPMAVMVADLTGEHTSSASTPIPEARQVSAEARSEPEWRAIRAGGLLFGGSYALCVGGAASRGFDEGTGRLAIPIAGPWLALDSGNAWALVMAGTAQLAGVTFVVWGFARPRRVLGPAEASVSLTAAPDSVHTPAVRLDVRF